MFVIGAAGGTACSAGRSRAVVAMVAAPFLPVERRSPPGVQWAAGTICGWNWRRWPVLFQVLLEGPSQLWWLSQPLLATGPATCQLTVVGRLSVAVVSGILAQQIGRPVSFSAAGQLGVAQRGEGIGWRGWHSKVVHHLCGPLTPQMLSSWPLLPRLSLSPFLCWLLGPPCFGS